MSMKEWTPVIQLVGVMLVAGWLLFDGLGGGFSTADFAAVAMRLVWVIGAAIVFNIAMTILVAIGVGIVTRAEFKDEKADERDIAIDAKSMRNGGVITSSVAALSLIAIALGVVPIFAVYALFLAPLLGGATDAVSRIVYYRIG